MELKCETEKHEESGSITDGNKSTNQNSSENSEITLSSTDQLFIGVVIGAVVLLLLILVLIIICKKRKKRLIILKFFQNIFF